MTATAHTIPTRRQRLTHSWMIAAAAAAIAFPLGLIVAYVDTDGMVISTTSTTGSPAAATVDEAVNPTSPGQPTLLVPGRPDGYWLPPTEVTIPPRVQ